MTKIANHAICVGQLYSNEEIQQFLGVGNAGGVRINKSHDGTVRRAVIMTSTPSGRQAKENPYHDRIENDILVYTASGLEGDQSLGGMNKRIPEQRQYGFPIYGFQIIASRRDQKIGVRRWLFLGLLQYLRHYSETQIDTRDNLRKVWLFEIKAHKNPDLIFPDQDFEMSKSLLDVSWGAGDQLNLDEEAIVESPDIAQVGQNQYKPEELETIRRQLLAQSPREFENFVSLILSSTGYERVAVTKFSQDGGIDVVAYAGKNMWAIENLMVQIQAKRWLHTVGRKEVAELRGSLEPHARGTIITTSYYSKAAMAEASATGKAPIVLVDGYSLAGIVKSANLGNKFQ